MVDKTIGYNFDESTSLGSTVLPRPNGNGYNGSPNIRDKTFRSKIFLGFLVLKILDILVPDMTANLI